MGYLTMKIQPRFFTENYVFMNKILFSKFFFEFFSKIFIKRGKIPISRTNTFTPQTNRRGWGFLFFRYVVSRHSPSAGKTSFVRCFRHKAKIFLCPSALWWYPAERCTYGEEWRERGNK